MTEPNFYAAPSAPLLDPNASGALTCPWCSAAATVAAIPQSCGRCGRRFTLSAGPALDGSIVPAPFHPGTPNVSVRWSIVVTYRFATLDPVGVTYGTLDPVVGLAPIDQTGIAYADVVSIAVWRKLALVEPIIGILIPLPIAFFAAYGAILAATKSAGGAAIFGLVALVFGIVGGWLVYRGVAIGRRNARIVGRWHSFTVPFDNSRAFYEHLFRRCGLAPPPVP